VLLAVLAKIEDDRVDVGHPRFQWR
jgi:hypothetical protein